MHPQTASLYLQLVHNPALWLRDLLAGEVPAAGLRMETMVSADRQNPAAAMAARIPVYSVPTSGTRPACLAWLLSAVLRAFRFIP